LQSNEINLKIESLFDDFFEDYALMSDYLPIFANQT